MDKIDTAKNVRYKEICVDVEENEWCTVVLPTKCTIKDIFCYLEELKFNIEGTAS